MCLLLRLLSFALHVCKIHYSLVYRYFIHFQLLSSIALYGCTTCCLSAQPIDEYLDSFHFGVHIKKKLP